MSMTKAELLEKAKELKIEGVSDDMTNDELEKAIEKAEKAAEKAAKEAAAADKGKIKAKVNVTLYRSNTSHVHFKAGQVITDAEFAAQCKKDGLAE